MTDKKDDALKMALEALQTAHLAVEDDMLADEIQQAITAIREALAEQSAQQQEPLTDEEIEREWQFLHDEEGNPPDHYDFARAIEAAHGIKGDTK